MEEPAQAGGKGGALRAPNAVTESLPNPDTLRNAIRHLREAKSEEARQIAGWRLRCEIQRSPVPIGFRCGDEYFTVRMGQLVRERFVDLGTP